MICFNFANLSKMCTVLSEKRACVQVWGFANLAFDPGQPLWDAVAQNGIYTMHEYSPQNIANGEAPFDA